MTIESAVAQYGGVGLLVWIACQLILIQLTQWRAGIRAEAKARDMITQEREVINGMLKRRDEDARAQQQKNEQLEGEIAMLRSVMDEERAASKAQISALQHQLDESAEKQRELAQRLTDSEQTYQIQLHSAEAQISALQQEIDQLKAQMRAIEAEKQSLVTRLFDELKTVARITGELEFLKGERSFADRVLAKITPTTYVEPGVIYAPFSPV